MLKILFRLLKTITIGLLWTYLFLIIANIIMITVWNFSIFSINDWRKMSLFWEQGGIIKNTKDYMFLFSFVFLTIIWLYIWKKLCRLNYLNILIFPIIMYNNRVIAKYGSDSKRIILKNLQPTTKVIEEIKSQIESIKPGEAQKGTEIRSSIADKINNLNQ